ncbi:MAG: T9SS type A sorting domain-containing protein [Flavobacteriales bacterium]|nr:T9SS type A sorting domain-containing protein [Flavobacteriales bacterium]
MKIVKLGEGEVKASGGLMRLLCAILIVNLIMVFAIAYQANAQVITKSAWHYLKVGISSDINGYSDETLIFFYEGSTHSSNDALDAVKLTSHITAAPSIGAITNDGKALSISYEPLITEGFDIILEVKVGVSGTYRLTRNAFHNMDDASCVVIEDLVTGDVFDLTSDTPYSFEIESGEYYQRFLIHIGAPFNSNVLDASCFGQNDGVVSVDGVGTGPFNYIWKDADNNTIASNLNSSGANDDLAGLGAGEYTVEMTDFSGLCSYIETLVVGEPEEVVTSFATSADVVNLMEGGYIDFENTSDYTNDCSWAFGDGSISSMVSPTYGYSNAGEFSVELTTNNNGCYTSFEKKIVVNDIFTSVTEKATYNGMEVYPNPTNGSINIKSNQQNASLIIFDITGRVVAKGNLNDKGSFKGTIANNLNGVYLVQISDGNTAMTRKILLTQ